MEDPNPYDLNFTLDNEDPWLGTQPEYGYIPIPAQP